jgi:myosin heavy subunit
MLLLLLFVAAAVVCRNSTSKIPQTLTLDHVSPATRLLEKRRQMFEVQEALDAQKEEFIRREDAFKRREETLRKKDLELQESLIKFNKFLHENESKRNRALKRANDEVKQRQAKELEITKLKEQLQTYQQKNDKLQKQVHTNMKYQKYLEIVQEKVPEDYPEILDLVHRYNTLKETNIDLSKNQFQHEEETELKRNELTFFQKEKNTEILNINNEIATLQNQLETKDNLGVRLQQEADFHVKMLKKKTLQLGQIFMAIENLVQRSTSGIHGQILKHMEAATTTNDLDENTSQRNTTTTTTSSSSSTTTSTTTNNTAATSSTSTGSSSMSAISEQDVIRHGLKAMNDLEIVGAYMQDFQAIVQHRLEFQRAQKKAAAVAAAAAAANGTNGASNTTGAIGNSNNESGTQSGNTARETNR